MAIQRYRNNLLNRTQNKDIRYLTSDQLNSLTNEFMNYYDLCSSKRRKYRGRYWLVYVMLKATGARLGEVLQINDATDIDYRNSKVKLITLKQKTNLSYSTLTY
jgi:molybdate transport system regulatory protein